MSKRKNHCTAILEIADDYGDNIATMHCDLPRGHGGMHIETFDHTELQPGAKQVIVGWIGDDADLLRDPDVPKSGPKVTPEERKEFEAFDRLSDEAWQLIDSGLRDMSKPQIASNQTVKLPPLDSGFGESGKTETLP